MFKIDNTLLDDEERLPDPPFKLKFTYDAIDHWKLQRSKNEKWVLRYDKTILNQAKAYSDLLKGDKVKFIPEQAEDFCFAYVFGYITAEEAEKKWPALHGHESDRIIEIKEMLDLAKQGKGIPSKDHRVVQAIAMWGKVNNKSANILYPSVVSKSWPEFWDFLNA